MFDKFTVWAKNNGWNIIASSGKTELPENIKTRYDIPEKWYQFVSALRVCEDKTATKWFLTPGDFLPREDGFQWNEFELMSLEYANDESSITAFWDRHLPVFMSVDGEYSYYAVDTESGKVVNGCEPEFEDVTVAADSFEEFIGKIISGEIVL